MSGKSGAHAGVPRVLHIHGSLAATEPQAQRCVRLIEAFGGRLRHTMVAADDDFGALAGLSKGLSVARDPGFPRLGGVPLPGRLQRIAQAMTDHHLVLTYGRAGIAAALAHTVFGEMTGAPPLIHHEDGSDETAAQRRGLRSRWLRRLGLGKAAGLVVPTETMEAEALVAWHQPLGRVKHFPDGVDAKRFGRKPAGKGIARLLKRDDEFWIGCFVARDGGEGMPALLKDLSALEDNWHLVMVGDGPAVTALRSAASPQALDHRVHAVPTLSDRVEAIALFDIVALSGGREPLPLPVVEAMMAGKPVVGLDPLEAEAVLSPENAELGAGALGRLATEAHLRRQVGAANRERALRERSEAAMIAAYRRLYASAMRRETI